MTLRLSAVMIVLLYVSSASGQSGGDYILTWSTIDGGGMSLIDY